MREFPPFDQKDVERFMSKIKFFDHDGCWEFMSFLDKNGYGRMRLRSQYIGAHRLSYYFAFGEFDQKMLVCHKCDNPSCVNPNHLFLGTVKDNARDMVIKKRGKEQKRTHCSKGHEFNAENTYYVKGAVVPIRRCKKCDRGYHSSDVWLKRRRELRKKSKCINHQA